jgi:hypothetical protein
MIKIIGVVGTRSKNITEYNIFIKTKINPILICGSLWELNNSIGLVYKIASTNNGYLHIIIGFGATKQMNTLQQVKNKAAKILHNLGGAIIANGVNNILLSNIKYRDIVIEVLNDNSKSKIEIKNILLELNAIVAEASSKLYLASSWIKDCKNELEN